MKKQQRGFTLIELIIVIVILGILAVTAAPRFLDISSDARVSAMNGVLGSVKSASQIAHAAVLVKGLSDDIDLEGVQIHDADGAATAQVVNGYPQAEDVCKLVGLQQNTTGAGTAGADDVGDNLSCDTSTATQVVIQDDNAPTPENCSVKYVEADAGNQPTITITTTGCSA